MSIEMCGKKKNLYLETYECALEQGKIPIAEPLFITFLI